MASIKIIHRTSKVYKNGTSPVIIRISQNRKVKESVLFSVLPDQWNDVSKRVIPKKHPNYASLNIKLIDEFNRLEKILIDNERIDLETIFDEPKEVTGELSLRQIADLYIKHLERKSSWTVLTFGAIINKFFNKIGTDSIKFNQLTNTHVSKWLSSMAADGNKENTIHNNVKIIRFLADFAERNGYGTKPPALYNIKVSPGQASYKVKLTPQEFEAFKNCPLDPKMKLNEGRDMFVLSVYLRGMRASDIIQLKQKYFIDGRLKYKSQKTDKVFDLKLVPEALDIVNRYLDGREYLFTFYKFVYNDTRTFADNELIRVTHIKSITANVNKKIKAIAEKAGIKKNVSMHIARHTFARMALEKINDTNITMDLLGHSKIDVHQAYIREIMRSDELDDAADVIFGQ